MPKLYALLVGINKYHPRSGVTRLSGCVNDMQSVKQFIKKQYADLTPDCKELINTQATRANIINTFRSHLIKNAKEGDTVLFFYAGHGSNTQSATPFRKFDGIGQDETLVCYDSRLPGNYDLTDKEIAVLLSEIKEGVHVAVIADSCHSASLTRSNRPELEDTVGLKKRHAPGTNENRALESYLLKPDNFYAKQASVQIPRSKHVLMSACNRDEFAWETADQRGLFTTNLLRVLEKNPNISYQDLFARVRTLVYYKDQNQLPTLHPMEGFNPNTVFLREGLEPNSKRYQIKKVSDQWRLEYGAIDGLPTTTADKKDLVISVYENIGDQKPIGTSRVSNILLKESVLNKDDTDKLVNTTNYWGEIQSFPAAMVVNLEGNKAAFWEIKNALEEKFPFVEIVEDIEGTKYSLEITKEDIRILSNPDKQLIHGAEGLDNSSISYILDILTRLEGWERVSALQNEATNLEKDKLEVVYIDETDVNKPIPHTSNTITLDYFKQGEDKNGNDLKGLFYTIKAKNNSSKTLHVALVHADSEYQVKTYFPCGEFPPNKEITLDNQHGLAIMSSSEQTATDIFKVIVSTEPFDDFKLNQKGFEVGVIAGKSRQSKNRGSVKRGNAQTISDWCTKTITVKLVRSQSDLGKKNTTLSGLTFIAHPFFSAAVSTGQAEGSTKSRSVHPSQQLAKLCQQSGLSLVNLSGKGTRNVQQAQTLIELNDIKHKEALAETPLEFSIDAATSNGELIIPVTMQDGLLIPFGDIVQEADGSTTIKISSLPEGIDAPANETGKRSLGKALWFSLLKVTGFEEQTFLLRKVTYKNEKATRIPVKKSDFDQAKNILLAVHGIIGDTQSIIDNLAFLSEDKQYDLILTFDYENLNTNIEDIAEKLNTLLTANGLEIDDGKRMDIIAHSMGGLVSRYLIEQIREGDNLVDHLYMFGTPNGGSVFGNLPAYRDRLILLLTAGLNFGKAWLGQVGVALGIVNKILVGSKALTKTLAQMSPDSTFIKNLSKGKKGHTTYTVIAGNTTDYQSLKDKKMAKLMEKLLIKAGNTANDAPNDVAVLVEDILKVPDNINAEKHKICCHHMNYFDDGPGLDMVKKHVRLK